MATNVPLRWGVLVMEEAVHVWGAGGIWKIPVPSVQSCCEFETALKIVYQFKKIRINPEDKEHKKEGHWKRYVEGSKQMEERKR